MNQKISLVLFITGLAGYLGSLSEYFSLHDSWKSMTTPHEVASLLSMIVTFLMTIAGALGTQLPRDTSKNFRDRVSDKKINEINNQGEKL